jgi:hypothetical protein
MFWYWWNANGLDLNCQGESESDEPSFRFIRFMRTFDLIIWLKWALSLLYLQLFGGGYTSKVRITDWTRWRYQRSIFVILVACLATLRWQERHLTIRAIFSSSCYDNLNSFSRLYTNLWMRNSACRFGVLFTRNLPKNDTWQGIFTGRNIIELKIPLSVWNGCSSVPEVSLIMLFQTFTPLINRSFSKFLCIWRYRGKNDLISRSVLDISPLCFQECMTDYFTISASGMTEKGIYKQTLLNVL